MNCISHLIFQVTLLSISIAPKILLAETKDTDAKMSRPYQISIGIRYGIEKGISIKHYVNNNTAFEGILSKDGYYNASRITILYELENSIGKRSELYWFYGVGAHISFYKSKLNQYNTHAGYYDYRGLWHDTDNRLNYSSGGFDGIIGIEYLMKHIPLSIRVDSKPNINILDQTINYLNVAVTICCYFNWNQKIKKTM